MKLLYGDRPYRRYSHSIQSDNDKLHARAVSIKREYLDPREADGIGSPPTVSIFIS